MHSPANSSDTKIAIYHSLYDRRHQWAAFVIAAIFTFIFFYPSLRKAGLEAGVAFSGDALAELIPQFLISGYYTSHGIFSGIDVFTHNGASEFFLRPNLPVYDPFILLLSPIFLKGGLPQVALMYMIIGAIHAFVCTYFTHRLLVRFLKFDLALATFGAVGYAFSMQVVNFLWYLPHDLAGWLFPVMIYTGLVAARQFNFRSVFLLSPPAFLTLVSGYVPMAMTSVALAAVVIVWLQLAESRAADIKRTAIRAGRALAPMAIATAIALPYYLALAQYHAFVEIAQRPGADELAPVAYTLAESPINIVRAVSNNFVFSGPRVETTFFLGLVPLSILVIYLATTTSSIRAAERVGASDGFHRMLLLVSLFFYFGSLLIVFGANSVASDLFYYFVPVAGKMHIYQRYLLITQFFLVLAIALMLRKIAIDEERRMSKILIAGLVAAIIFVIYALNNGFWHGSIVSESFVVDLLMAVLFLMSYNLLSYRGVVLSGTIFMFLTTLQPMYRYSNGSVNFAKLGSEALVANKEEMQGLLAYFREHSAKAIVKYVDIVPNPQPFVPQNLPWVTANNIKLSNYYGYDWHLGVNYLYRRQMPIILAQGSAELAFRADWQWLRLTGAEFVIFEEGNKYNDPHLEEFVDLDPRRIYRFTGRGRTFVAAPLRFPPDSGAPIVFDNGYVRIRSDDSQATVGHFNANDAGSIEFSTNAHAPVEVEYLFWPNSRLRAAVDGNGTAPLPERRLMTYVLPAGNHMFHMVYVNHKLRLFLIAYLVYGVALIAVGTLEVGRRLWTHGGKIASLEGIQS